MSDSSVFYFAYGSNADTERFRSRVGPWRSSRPGFLEGYRLRFADSVQSEGGGGAVVDPDPDGRVAGVLFEITEEQLQAMDREEFRPDRDHSGKGRRETRSIRTADGVVSAEIYLVNDEGGWCAPSKTYLGFILKGLETAGHSAEVIAAVRRVAESAD